MKQQKGLLVLAVIITCVVIFLQFGEEKAQPSSNSNLVTVLQAIEGVGAVQVYIHDNQTARSTQFFQMTEQLEDTEGILVVCEGAEDAAIKRKLLETIERVMNIPSHRIVILPMKKGENT